MFPSTAFKRSEQIPRLAHIQRVRKLAPPLDGRGSMNVQTWGEPWNVTSVDRLQKTLWFGLLATAAFCCQAGM